MPTSVRPVLRALLLAAVLAFSLPRSTSGADGLMGIFLDDRGTVCSGSIAQGSTRWLYVVLLPEGDTRGGITGAEFRIQTDASGYLFRSEEVLLGEGFKIGDALGAGTSVVAGGAKCQSGLAIPILRFQVQNLGGSNDTRVYITPKNPPENPNFPCPLVNLCDDPAYTAVCIDPGKAVLNPTGSVACGSSRESAEWSRVKELYR